MGRTKLQTNDGFRLVAKVSRDLVTMTDEDLEVGIGAALQTLGEACAHQRAYVFVLNDSVTSIEDAHEWVEEGTVGHDFDVFRGVSVDAFPWSMQQFLAGETVIVHDPEVLPDAAAPERGACELMSIQSYVNVPLIAGGKLAGWLGFDATNAATTWDPSQIELMRLAADVLAAALDRNRRQRTLDLQREKLVRMTTAASLAQGLAHDINNPLTWVLGNLDQFRQYASTLVPKGERREQLQLALDDAREGAVRIREVVRGLRSLTSTQKDSAASVNLEQMLDLTLRIAADELRGLVRVERQASQPPDVLCDPTVLGQALLGLYSAIATALRGFDTGSDRGSTQGVATGSETPWKLQLQTSQKARRIVLRIILAPQGADAQPQRDARISAVRGAVAGCAGRFAEVGGTLTLEASDAPQNGSAAWTVSLRRADVLWQTPANDGRINRGFGHVLVVDDELAFLRWTKAALHGSDVTMASDAQAALAVVDSDAPLDLILLDVMMPDCSGVELYDQLVQHRPELASKVIFVTAGIVGGETAASVEALRRPVITKPFGVSEIRAAVASGVTQ